MLLLFLYIRQGRFILSSLSTFEVLLPRSYGRNSDHNRLRLSDLTCKPRLGLRAGTLITMILSIMSSSMRVGSEC